MKTEKRKKKDLKKGICIIIKRKMVISIAKIQRVYILLQNNR